MTDDGRKERTLNAVCCSRVCWKARKAKNAARHRVKVLLAEQWTIIIIIMSDRVGHIKIIKINE